VTAFGCAQHPHFVSAPLIRPMAGYLMTSSITLVGRVATEPAAVFYESGAIRVTFAMAINRRRFGDPPDLFHLELWGKQAQRAHNELQPDALIGVIGEIRIRDGHPWVLVDRLERLGTQGASASANAPTEGDRDAATNGTSTIAEALA